MRKKYPDIVGFMETSYVTKNQFAKVVKEITAHEKDKIVKQYSKLRKILIIENVITGWDRAKVLLTQNNKTIQEKVFLNSISTRKGVLE